VLPLLLALAVALPSGSQAQGISLAVAALLPSPVAQDVSVGYLLVPAGALDATVSGRYLNGWDGERWGVGIDLALWRGARTHLYPTGGFAAGFVAGGAEEAWAAWSVGLGYRLLRAGGFDLALEGKYLHLSRPEDALTLGVRMGVRFGGAAPRPSPVGPARPPDTPALGFRLPTGPPLAQAIIQTALDAMGTPYAWGGTDTNGFDCSGLIQYAYRQHGIELPRKSSDQAREGVEIERKPEALLPGDILAFGASRSQVTHVGLYLGDGRFIHSGSAGVRVSVLSGDDDSGRYWWQRWVGARRILQD
jgi:hypothetical protein